MDIQLLQPFYALTPPSTLQFPSIYSPTEINDFLVNNILLSSHFQRYPPSNQYQRQFWKWAIGTLERLARGSGDQEYDDDFEIDSRIYDHYLSLMPRSESIAGPNHLICGRGIAFQEAPPSQSYITHFWNFPTPLTSSPCNGSSVKMHTVTLLESRTTIESGTTGFRTWMASFVLAQYLILHPELVASQRVLELGSGIGFLGIIVASLQQLQNPLAQTALSGSSLWITDVNAEVLARCRDNINLPCNLSSFHPDTHYRNLDWSQSMDADHTHLETLIHEIIDPDLILGADVVFNPILIPSLVGTLKIALRSSKSSNKAKVSIIAVTMRNEDTLKQFLTQLQEESLHAEEMEAGSMRRPISETIDAHHDAQNIKVFRVTYI